MQFPTIWFLRHGQTEWNAQHRIQGQLESDLTPLGVAQARDQARLMPPILAQGPACYVSPLGRAQKTAEIALGGAPCTTDPRLAEVHAGVFQGLTKTQAAQLRPDITAACPEPLDLFCEAPDGEGYATFHNRIEAFLQSLTGPSVVVAHGLWGQVLRGIICGLDRAEQAKLPNEQGCVYLLRDGRETVLR